MFRRKTQPSFISGTNDTTTPNAVAERTLKHANKDSRRTMLLTISGSANNIIKNHKGRQLND